MGALKERSNLSQSNYVKLAGSTVSPFQINCTAAKTRYDPQYDGVWHKDTGDGPLCVINPALSEVKEGGDHTDTSLSAKIIVLINHSGG